jgi:pimeloyl-ACP methyl ester carboxylesterase
MATTTRPFSIEISDSVLEDLQQRLARTRFPGEIPDSGWDYGANLAYLKEFVSYWRDSYDWRTHETRLNRLNQVQVKAGGLWIHAVHERGKGPDPMPLCITHGWPGSFAEFEQILGPLTDPAAHGGDAADSFDVILPSMPGYGFSEGAREPGMDCEKIAAIWVELMAGLGYERFAAQGGDWGAIVTSLLGANHAEQLLGIHLNMAVAFPGDSEKALEGLSEEDMAGLGDLDHFQKFETGYQQIQGTKPQTLAYGLNDSPAGLAGWIVEKFHTWSDCDGDIESVYTKDQLLTNIMLYWLPEAIGSSVRLYCESMRTGKFPPTGYHVDVPTGVAMFPREIIRTPRAWIEDTYNLQHFRRFEKGGHFAAMEQPAALVESIRDHFRPLR